MFPTSGTAPPTRGAPDLPASPTHRLPTHLTNFSECDREDVRVRALGPLEIELIGRPAANAFSQSRPRELFLYLLCHPEGRTREQVGLALWPDAAGKQLKNNFHVALHHLRKALGHPDWVTLDGERYRIARAARVWFDATIFEREIVTALRDRSAESTERLARALDLYRGPFLAGEPVGDWHLQLHDRLRRLCVDGRFELGRRLMDAEQLAEAAEAFQHLLQLEDLHEEAYRHLMVCEARLGARIGALRRYERLVLHLRDELDAEPEPETVRLYDRLRRAEPV
jgi:DNA-binding SARP family transcriptional activator